MMLARLGLCTLMLAPWSAPVYATDIPALVQKAKPAVVEILTYDQQNKLLKTGTGFFISPDGALLTNYHVISGGSSIMAKMPTGTVYFLKAVLMTSETSDVTELQFFATDVPSLPLGSSLSAVEGQRVLVIGNPEGLEGTVSDGIISAFRSGRTIIQITAPVSHGSSGSPVLDESGNVIGVATQVLREGQNLNFAISVEAIRDALAKSSNPNPWVLYPAVPTPTAARGSAGDFFNRAFEEAKNGDYDGAIADYTEAIRLQPNYADAFINRGIAYDSVKQYDKALSDLNEAIRLKPDFAYAYNGRGQAFYYLGRHEKAISDYTEAIRLKPDNLDAYYDRGNIYFGLAQYDKAISDFSDAIRLQPNSADAYNNRGVCYANLKQYHKAVTDYSEAIRLKPDYVRAYENRAITYDDLGNRSRAVRDRKKARELKDKL
jgi:Flp pilus assembly protein TadD